MKFFTDKLFFIILLLSVVACGTDEHKETHKFDAAKVEVDGETEESQDATNAASDSLDQEEGDSVGICIIITFKEEVKSLEEIAEYLKENYKDKTGEELAEMLHECNTPAELMIIILIKTGMNVKEAITKVIELTDCSIQLVIKVLKEHLLMPTAEIIKILFELKKFTMEQIVEILQAAIESGLLIKDVVIEEVLVYLHTIGEPLLKVVECALNIGGDSIQLVIRILHDRLLVPTGEIVKILVELGKFTAEQVAEILKAAIEAGVLVSEVVVTEFLTVLHAVGEPIAHMIKCALMIAENSIELILTILKDKLLMPGAEIARALIELGVFSTGQIVKLVFGILGLGVETIIEIFKAAGMTADAIREIIREVISR